MNISQDRYLTAICLAQQNGFTGLAAALTELYFNDYPL